MKSFVWVIFFSWFVWAGVGAMQAGAVPAVQAGMCTFADLQEHASGGDAIVAIDGGCCASDMEIGGTNALAHSFTASAERMLRISSLETSQFVKNLLRRMAVRTAALAGCYARMAENAACGLTTDTACDYYVFAMRRILI